MQTISGQEASGRPFHSGGKRPTKKGRGETKQQAKQHASHQAEQTRREGSAGRRQGGGGQHSGATKFQRTSVCEETPLRHILLALQDQVGSTKQRPQLDKHRRLRGEEKQDQTDQTDRPRQRSTKRSEHGRQVQAAGEATLAQALQGPMCDTIPHHIWRMPGVWRPQLADVQAGRCKGLQELQIRRAVRSGQLPTPEAGAH